MDGSGDGPDGCDGGRSEVSGFRQAVACIPDGVAITAQPAVSKRRGSCWSMRLFTRWPVAQQTVRQVGYIIPPSDGYLSDVNPFWVSLKKSHLGDGIYTDEISGRGKGGSADSCATAFRAGLRPVAADHPSHCGFPRQHGAGNSEQLIRRNERLACVGLLAAGIAHEINNPTGAALLAAETALAIKDLPEAGERLTACLQNIVTSMDRCGRIVRTLLRYTRQEPTEKQACSINDVAEQAIDLARPYAGAHGAKLRLELGPVVPLVSMNPLEIELVMVNLIRNAIEAGDGNVQVCVVTAQTEWGVRVTVRDNGCGMDEEQLAHVFDPLHTTRRHLGGSGLGMSIAHDIVHEHQGRLEVRSRQGKGTTVIIDLPAASGAGRSSDKKGHADHGSNSDCGNQSLLRRRLGLYAGGGEA